MKHKRALPIALAFSRSSSLTPVLVAVPLKPNTFSASRPTRGAAQAATAPSKHLGKEEEGNQVLGHVTESLDLVLVYLSHDLQSRQMQALTEF